MDAHVFIYLTGVIYAIEVVRNKAMALEKSTTSLIVRPYHKHPYKLSQYVINNINIIW